MGISYYAPVSRARTLITLSYKTIMSSSGSDIEMDGDFDPMNMMSGEDMAKKQFDPVAVQKEIDEKKKAEADKKKAEDKKKPANSKWDASSDEDDEDVEVDGDFDPMNMISGEDMQKKQFDPEAVQKEIDAKK